MGPETGKLASAHELDNFDRSTRIDDRRLSSRLSYDLAVEFNGDPIGGQPECLEQVGNARAFGNLMRFAVEQKTDVFGLPDSFGFFSAGHRSAYRR